MAQEEKRNQVAPQPAARGRSASGDEIVVLCWNLYHGRDRPPNPRLFTLRSRLLRKTEDDGVHVQVNRSLKREFGELITGARWSLCLLQEAPPTWAAPLAERSRAQPHCVRTSRNQLASLTSRLARWNPDLLGSWEGGSNLTLVRPPWKVVAGSERSLLLNPLSVRRLRERRRMSFVRLRASGPGPAGAELCVANLHASHYARKRAELEVRLAAETAFAWSLGEPLILGGDFNLRPRTSSLFDQLERELGLTRPTAPDGIDHLLVRGLELIRAPARWPDQRRELEVSWDGSSRRLRLSDHAPLEAVFRLSPAMRY